MKYKGRCIDGPMAGQYFKNGEPVMVVIAPVEEYSVLNKPRYGTMKVGEYWFNGTSWSWYPEKPQRVQ